MGDMEPPPCRELSPSMMMSHQMDTSVCSMLLTSPTATSKPSLVVGTCDGLVFFFPGDVDYTVAPPHISSNMVQQDTPVEALTFGRVLCTDQYEIVAIAADGTLVMYRPPQTDRPIQKIHQQIIQANVKAAYIMDIDQDGNMELVVVLTDRVVRTFRWHSVERRMLPLNKWEVPNQITAFGIGTARNAARNAEIILSQMGASFFVTIPLNESRSGADQTVLSHPNDKNQAVMMLPWRTEFAYVMGSMLDNAMVKGAPNDPCDRSLVANGFHIIATTCTIVQDIELVITLDIRGLVEMYAAQEGSGSEALYPFATFYTEPNCEHLVLQQVNVSMILLAVANVNRYVYLYKLPMDDIRTALRD